MSLSEQQITQIYSQLKSFSCISRLWFYLQGFGERSVFTVDQEQRGNTSIMKAKCCISKCLQLPSWSSDEEDGHLPHEETTAHSLEGVVGHKVHGVVQLALLPGLQRLQSLDVLKQGPFLHCVSEADLSGDFIIVQGQSNASASWTVALRNGDISDKAQDCLTHVVEVLAAVALRDVQGERQLGGVKWAFLLT